LPPRRHAGFCRQGATRIFFAAKAPLGFFWPPRRHSDFFGRQGATRIFLAAKTPRRQEELSYKPVSIVAMIARPTTIIAFDNSCGFVSEVITS
jgi:hypothetical protein